MIAPSNEILSQLRRPRLRYAAWQAYFITRNARAFKILVLEVRAASHLRVALKMTPDSGIFEGISWSVSRLPSARSEAATASRYRERAILLISYYWHFLVAHNRIGTSPNSRNRWDKRLFGERGGTRTRDPMIKSHVLYRLSYALTLSFEHKLPHQRVFALVARKTGSHAAIQVRGRPFSGSCSSPRCVGGRPVRVNSARCRERAAGPARIPFATKAVNRPFSSYPKPAIQARIARRCADGSGTNH